jgi:hypothetical protein
MVSACVDKKMRETMAKAKNKQTRQGKVQKGKSSKQPSKNISLIISSRNHQICLCSVERGGL